MLSIERSVPDRIFFERVKQGEMVSKIEKLDGDFDLCAVFGRMRSSGAASKFQYAGRKSAGKRRVGRICSGKRAGFSG